MFLSSRVELLFLSTHKSQMSWFRLQVRMPPLCLPRGGFLGMSIQEEILGNTWGFLVLSAGLELPWDFLEELVEVAGEGSVWRKLKKRNKRNSKLQDPEWHITKLYQKC